MNRRISSPTFVGRGQELRRLDELLGLAEAGTPGAVLVAGEAGVGKTRLVKEFTTRATTAGACVLAGGCIAFAEGELAYGPLVEALRSLVHRPDPAAEPILVGGVGSELARLLPELGGSDHPAPEPAEATQAPAAGGGGRLRLFEQLLGLLERLGRSSPVVLVVEDLQWADRSTMEFLAFLLRNLHGMRLVLVGTYRTDELGPTHWLRGWIAEQRRSGQIDELQLAPFSRGELAEQLGGVFGAPVDAELVDSIYARCEGNAFFAEELAAAAAKGLAAELPSGLREVLLARLQGLSGPARAVLGVAAVAGRRVDHRLLVAATAMAEGELVAALREAVNDQLLVTRAQDETLAFRHAVLQEAVYGELLPGERTHLHAVFAPALAELLESGAVDRPTATAEIARHWDLARDLPMALAWAVRAGAEAERVYAFAEALAHDQRALALWNRVSDPEQRTGMDRVDLLRRAAHAADAVGDYRRAAGLVELALAQVDPVAEPMRAGLLQERRGWSLRALGDDDEAAFAAYRQAVRLVPATPPSVERARVLATFGRALMISFREEEALAVCEEALAMARQLGAEREVGLALGPWGNVHVERGNFGVGIAALREALGIAQRLAEPDNLGPAYLNLGTALWYAGRVDEALEVEFAGYETMRRLGRERQYGGFLLGNAAGGLIELGRWDKADEVLRRALELSPSEGWTHARLHCEIAELAIVRGQLDKAEEHLNQARPSAAQGALMAAVDYRYALAELRAWQGRLEEAQAAVAEALNLLATTSEALMGGGLVCLGLRIRPTGPSADGPGATLPRWPTPATPPRPSSPQAAQKGVSCGPWWKLPPGQRQGTPSSHVQKDTQTPASGNRPPKPGASFRGPITKPTPPGARPKPCSPATTTRASSRGSCGQPTTSPSGSMPSCSVGSSRRWPAGPASPWRTPGRYQPQRPRH